jgi:hypothetical protein
VRRSVSPFFCTIKGNELKLSEVLATIDGIVISEQIDLELEVYRGVSADLMSDALRFGKENMLLVTGLTNPQVVRTAEMIGITALLFVRAKLPPPETIALAHEAGIALIATRFTMYESSGLLYKAGLPGIGPCGEFE